MKENKSKIAFICFQKLFRIGTFQGVMPDSNKKICPLTTLASEVAFLRQIFLCSVMTPSGSIW
jgi:hypothetical protein